MYLGDNFTIHRYLQHHKLSLILGVGKTSIIYSHKYGGKELISCNATIGASYVNCDV